MGQRLLSEKVSFGVCDVQHDYLNLPSAYGGVSICLREKKWIYYNSRQKVPPITQDLRNSLMRKLRH